LENKLEELISIVPYVDQHRLGPTWKLLHEHQVKDEAGRVTGYTGLEKIGQTLAPVMIRRHKSEVLRQLPSRTDQNLRVPMTEMQMLYHQENADVVAKIVQRWRKTKFLSDKDQRRLTCALQNMRMSCNSTYLLDQETDHGVKADELAALFDELFASPRPRRWCFRNGRGPTTSSSAASKRASWATSASTAACHRTNGRHWLSGFETTPPAACSCPPMLAARASICSMLRPW